MDSATIALVAVFSILFCTCVLMPMVSLLITTGQDIRYSNERFYKIEDEKRELINRM